MSDIPGSEPDPRGLEPRCMSLTRREREHHTLHIWTGAGHEPVTGRLRNQWASPTVLVGHSGERQTHATDLIRVRTGARQTGSHSD